MNDRTRPSAVRHEATRSTGDLTRFADTFSDLADPDVMSWAWQ
jgi:hypothetical protein